MAIYKDVRGQHWRVSDDGQSRVPVSGHPLAVDTWNAKGQIIVCDAKLQTWLDTVPNPAHLLTRVEAAITAATAARTASDGVAKVLGEVKAAIALLDLSDGVDLTPITERLQSIEERLDQGISVRFGGSGIF